MDWRVPAPTQLAAHCFACFIPQMYEQKRDGSQSRFCENGEGFFFWGGGGGEGSPSSFLSIIIQKQHADKPPSMQAIIYLLIYSNRRGTPFFPRRL